MLEVVRGESVAIWVRSLRADEVRVEGYGVSARVNASRPAVVAFTADRAGRFGVRLDRLGFLLATVVVG